MTSQVSVRPVQSAREMEIFLKFPWQIYCHDPLWVPPLLPERRKLVDPRRSEYLGHAEAQFFIAWRGGHPVGTLSTAEDFAQNKLSGLHDCMIGFFESIPDAKVAQALFAAADNWAAGRGLTHLKGPFNFDYEDGYGVLIEGRDRPPALLCGHTPDYYQEFFELAGFTPARGDNLAFAVKIDDTEAIRSLFRMADRVNRTRSYTIRSARLDEWEAEIDRVYHLINLALAHLPDFAPWRREALQNLFAPFREVADPELILFVEDEGKVVGFFPGIPNLNEAFIHANGLRYPWNYLSLAYWMRRPTRCLAVKSVLVLPEYWGRGVAILLFAELYKRARDKGYQWIDLSLTSDDNPRTPVLAERFGGKIYKRYRVYTRPVTGLPGEDASSRFQSLKGDEV